MTSAFRSLAMVAAVILALARPASAAEVKVVDDALCKIELTGEIEVGDSRNLERLVRANKYPKAICLNSPGGSYPEALKLIDVILEANGIATVIKPDAECYSACALIFLAGSYTPEAAEGQKLLKSQRTLFAGGKLGFHAPYAADIGITSASPKTLAKAIKVGIDSIIDLLDRNRNEFRLFPDRLLRKAMRLGPDEMYEISTVGDAIRADIFIPQKVALPPVDEAAAIRACRNLFEVDGTTVQTVENVTHEKAGGVERYTVQFGILEIFCGITFAGPLDRLRVVIQSPPEPINEELTPKVAEELLSLLENSDTRQPWYYLLDENTPIESLRGDGKARSVRSVPMMYQGYDFIGPDIESVDTDSAYACAMHCADKGECKAFSYNRWAKKCFLKSSSSRARFDPRSVSGSLAGASNPGKIAETVQKFRGRKFKDEPFYKGDEASFDDCLASCLRESYCVAINFRKSDKQCESFTEVNEYFPDADYDAAMRWEAP